MDIFKVTNEDLSTMVCLYNSINNIEDLELLAQLSMTNKKDNELIIIMPGWNKGIKSYPNEYQKALKLSEKYK